MATKKTEEFVQNVILRIQKEMDILETNKDIYVKTAVDSSCLNLEGLICKKLFGKNMFGKDKQ